MERRQSGPRLQYLDGVDKAGSGPDQQVGNQKKALLLMQR